MTAQGNTILPMVLSGISAIVNVILDPVFIFTLNMGGRRCHSNCFIPRAIGGFWHIFVKKTLPNDKARF